MDEDEAKEQLDDRILKDLEKLAPVGAPSSIINAEAVTKLVTKAYQDLFYGHPREDIEGAYVWVDDDGVYHFEITLRGIPRHTYRFVPKTEEARKLFQKIAENGEVTDD